MTPGTTVVEVLSGAEATEVLARYVLRKRQLYGRFDPVAVLDIGKGGTVTQVTLQMTYRGPDIAQKKESP